VALLPLVVIALRDLIMLGMRAVHGPDGPLLPSSRWLGALLLTGVAATTATTAFVMDPNIKAICVGLYWVLAAVAMANIVWRAKLAVRKFSRSHLTFGAP
jgi:hypothetical protein